MTNSSTGDISIAPTDTSNCRDVDLELSLVQIAGVRAAVAPRDVANVNSSRAGLVYLLPSLEAPPRIGDIASLLNSASERSGACRVVFVDTLALTATGEVDVDRLPQRDPLRDEFGGVEKAPPRDAIEAQVAEAWSEVLGEPDVGRFDTFRGCDGYSLVAVQVASRLSAVLGQDVSVRHIHESHAVWHLAAILRSYRWESANDGPRIDQLAAEADQTAFPLSPYQRRIWAADQLSARAGTYNIAVAWIVRGDVDFDALGTAIGSLQRAHEVLRMRVDEVDGEALQRVVLPDVEDGLWMLDARDLPGGDAASAASDEARTPFDLARQGPFRARLLRLSAREHLLLLTVHHIAADGWSMGRLTQELAALYQGRAAVPSALTLRALVEAESRREAFCVASKAYWTQQLASQTTLPLPFDRPAPAEPTLAGDSVQFRISSDLTSAVRALALRHGCTPFAVFACVLQTFLFRISGQLDVCIGYPVARRDGIARETTLGCLINTLALRTRLHPREPFVTLLQRVRDGLLDATEHPDALLEQLRGPVQGSMYQAMLNLNEHDCPPLELAGLSVLPLARQSVGAPYPLTWILSTVGAEMSVRLEYDSARFTRETAERLGSLWLALLESAIGTPTCDVQSLPWMTSAQRIDVLALGDGGSTGDGQAPLPHRAFEAHARATPEACALICEGLRISYRELNRRANALARRLIDEGARPGVCVGIAVSRGVALAASLLAVQKTGAIYLPLDPQLPSARLAVMLANANVRITVTDSSTAGRAPGRPDMKVVASEAVGLDAQGVPGHDDDLIVDVPASTAAYCLYTSGSSGMPKGVLVSFSALAHHVAVVARAYSMSSIDVVLQFSSCAFDTSIEQSMAAWSSGAAVLMRDDAPWALNELVDRIRTQGVTVADIPGSYWNLLASGPEWPRDLTGLRLVIVGGEPIVASRRSSLPMSTRALNAYGPTETTVTCTTGPLDDSHGCGGPYVSIGRPLPGTRVHVLDERLEPMPIGIVGELFIAGPRVASGYLDSPAMTAERFLPYPFGVPGERMYRSGDMGRLLADGRIEFVGRRDLQVKVRGVRIELGEIEGTLMRHPAVQDAVALVSASGESAHLAVCVALSEGAASLGNVKAFVRNELPEGLFPSAWHVLPSMPLTVQGKVDRAALTRLIDQPQTTAKAPAPEAVSTTLSTLLELLDPLAPNRVSDPDAALVELGIHSVLFLRLVARCRDAFGVSLGLRDVLKAGTARRIAALIEDRMAESAVQ